MKKEYELCVQSAPVEWEQKNNRVLNPKTGLPKGVHGAARKKKLEAIAKEIMDELSDTKIIEGKLYNKIFQLAIKIYRGELKTIGIKP